MTDLYSSLPQKSYSLNEYIQTAKRLEHEDSLYFQQFLLTGENIPEHCQAFIDPTRNEVGDEGCLSIGRDYDSLIGIANDILVDTSISIHPAPNSEKVFKSGFYLNYHVIDVDVSTAFFPYVCYLLMVYTG